MIILKYFLSDIGCLLWWLWTHWFLGCYAVKFGDSPIFRRNISPQFSGLKIRTMRLDISGKHIASMFKVEVKAKQETNRSRRQDGSTLPSASTFTSFVSLHHEDGISPNYTELQPATPRFSKCLFFFLVYCDFWDRMQNPLGMRLKARLDTDCCWLGKLSEEPASSVIDAW